MFSAIVLLFSLCFSYFLKPTSYPPNEVTGNFFYLAAHVGQGELGMLRRMPLRVLKLRRRKEERPREHSPEDNNEGTS